MQEESELEKKNRRIGIATAIVAHLLLLLVLFFAIAWREEIPPPQPIGMSVNFGTSDAGSGNIQPRRSESETPEVSEAVEEPNETTEQAATQATEESQPEPQPSQTEAVQKEGPVKVEKESSTQTTQETTTPTPKPTETQPVEEKKEERKVEATFGPRSEESNSSTSQGTKEGTTGDQGSEEGDLNSKTTFGGAGSGGGGFSHSFTGWGTEFRLPDDKPEAEGVLEFKIKIDDRGDVVSIRTSKMIGNPEAEKFYKDFIQREMKFYRTQGGDIPPFSEGTITLNLKVK